MTATTTPPAAAPPGRRAPRRPPPIPDLQLVLPGPQAADPPSIAPRRRSAVAARLMNLLVALTALALVWPLFLVIAVAIKVTSPGPVIYRQERVGLDRRVAQRTVAYDCRRQDFGGAIFTMYKFRSMEVGSERKTGSVWARPDDPRTTKIGRLLRECRLDELPQLVNVVLGHMNVVGPRPERPLIFARLRREIPNYALRQRAKPGITGLAQVTLPYDTSVEDVRRKVALDLEYLGRQGVLEDLKIMALTLPTLLFRRGGW